jgi:hypothetical protein
LCGGDWLECGRGGWGGWNQAKTHYKVSTRPDPTRRLVLCGNRARSRLTSITRTLIRRQGRRRARRNERTSPTPHRVPGPRLMPSGLVRLPTISMVPIPVRASMAREVRGERREARAQTAQRAQRSRRASEPRCSKAKGQRRSWAPCSPLHLLDASSHDGMEHLTMVRAGDLVFMHS